MPKFHGRQVFQSARRKAELQSRKPVVPDRAGWICTWANATGTDSKLSPQPASAVTDNPAVASLASASSRPMAAASSEGPVYEVDLGLVAGATPTRA